MSAVRDAAAAWEALLRTHAALLPLMEEAVRGAVGTPLSWYDVLLELSRTAEGQLRMQDLGSRVVLSRSHTSRIVDAMAAAGLVAKTADPGDGRATLATLTGNGRQALRRAAPVYLRAIEANFGAPLCDDELAKIRLGLERIVARVRADAPI